MHSVIKAFYFYLMCTIFISDCWTSLIQSDTIWIYITIMVANMNLEYICNNLSNTDINMTSKNKFYLFCNVFLDNPTPSIKYH